MADNDTRKNKEISQRIAKIRHIFCEDNNSIFADKLGIKEPYASNICNGTKSTGDKLLSKILDSFPAVSKCWLYFGEGDMLRPEAAPPKPPDRPPEGEKTATGQTQGDTAGEIGQLKRTIAQLSDYNDLLKADNDRLKEELKREREKVASLSEQMNTEPTLL